MSLVSGWLCASVMFYSYGQTDNCMLVGRFVRLENARHSLHRTKAHDPPLGGWFVVISAYATSQTNESLSFCSMTTLPVLERPCPGSLLHSQSSRLHHSESRDLCCCCLQISRWWHLYYARETTRLFPFYTFTFLLCRHNWRRPIAGTAILAQSQNYSRT